MKDTIRSVFYYIETILLDLLEVIASGRYLIYYVFFFVPYYRGNMFKHNASLKLQPKC